jgi:ribosomal RNA-processing protein 12
MLPNTEFHLIRPILQETILNAKEVNEKTRTMAFDLLVEMGEKMDQANGCMISIPGAESVSSSIDLYLQMTLAGLAGVSAHMVAATVAAISRIIYQFRGKSFVFSLRVAHFILAKLDPNFVQELTKSILLLMKSNQKEIVKTTLGFIKIISVTYDKIQLESLLSPIVSRISSYSC